MAQVALPSSATASSSSSSNSSDAAMAKLRATLCDTSGEVKLDARFRALFHLKGLASISARHAREAIECISDALATSDSALLKHELAYVLGQMQNVDALPVLERSLRDLEEHAMVRHEAAEAMGAIGDVAALDVLREFLRDAEVSVRETCELAIRRIEHEAAAAAAARNDDQSKGTQDGRQANRADVASKPSAGEQEAISGASANAFAPIDPAPALPSATSSDATELLDSIPHYRRQLLDESLPLFERYRAMFSLRNAVHVARGRSQQSKLDSERLECAERARQAVEALADSLVDKSALFRHEICFVFGELAHPASVPSMLRVLSDPKEHEMVRHEAAEALGAVVEEEEEEEEDGDEVVGLEEGPGAGEVARAGEQTKGGSRGGRQRVLAELRRWAYDEDAPRVVRESCVVALDEIAYNNDPSQFQPVDAAVGESLSHGATTAGATATLVGAAA